MKILIRSRLLPIIAVTSLTAVYMMAPMAKTWAQAILPDNVPQNVLPGAVGAPLEKSVEQKTSPTGESLKPSQVNVTPSGEDAPSITLPSFKLEEIQVRNATLLTREDLAPIISPLMGQTVTEKELLKATHDITAIYQKKGYLTSKAFLPSQKVSSGVVVIVVQENKVGEITVVGNKHVPTDWVLSRITVKKGDLFNVKQLEAELNKIQKDPRIKQIRATIKPGERSDTNDTILEVADIVPIHLTTTIDNTGRSTVGVIHYNTTLVNDNFLGTGHQLVASYTGASGLHSIIGQYTIPLNDWGWKIGGRYSFGKTLIGGAFDFLDLTGRSDVFSIFTSIPVIKREHFNLTTDLSFNAKIANTYVGDVRLDVLEQNIQSISTGYNLVSADKLGYWTLDNHMDVAVGERAHFIKFRGNAFRVLRLPKGMALVLKSEGQYSPQNMPGMEQMQIGGFSTVRGYPEGFLMADYGFSLGSELHMPVWGAPEPIRKNTEWLLFAERGNIYLSDKNNPSVRGTPGNILSYGVGIRSQMSKYLTGRFDVGFAQRLDSDQPTGRIHFGVTGTPF